MVSLKDFDYLIKEKAAVCRDDWIRTSDPLVPNQMRYQLRYVPLYGG